jgi:hypothetical protein
MFGNVLQAGDLRAFGEKIGELMTKSLKHFLVIQGHQLTGALADSIEYKIVFEPNSMRVQFYMLQYAFFVNNATPASRIPFGGDSTGAKTSKYIQGLMQYARNRFGASTEKEAKRIAFAIARNHKKYGRPTPKSYQFSNNGFRTEFIENAIKYWEPDFIEAIQDFTFLFFSTAFSEYTP